LPWPVEAIAADGRSCYDYTSKGNTSVNLNGTAFLVLGNLGAAAAVTTVMESKSVFVANASPISIVFDMRSRRRRRSSLHRMQSKRIGNSFRRILSKILARLNVYH